MVESGSQKTQNYFSNYFHIQFVVAKFCLGYRLSGHNTKLPTKNKIKTRPPTQCPRLLSVFPTYLLRGVCRTRASSGPSRFFINDNKTILSTSPPPLPLTQQQPPFPPSLPPSLPTYLRTSPHHYHHHSPARRSCVLCLFLLDLYVAFITIPMYMSRT